MKYNIKTINMNDKRSHRSWSEATRNEFHPGVILALIEGHLDLSPSGNKELVELTCHFLGYGREYSEAYMDADNLIAGFYTRWLPKMSAISEQLTALYPQIAKYGNKLRVQGFLEEGIRDDRLASQILANIELRFGHAITVVPSKPIAKSPWSAQTFSPVPPRSSKHSILPPIKTANPQPGKKVF